MVTSTFGLDEEKSMILYCITGPEILVTVAAVKGLVYISKMSCKLMHRSM